jgi:hypothetical protein
LASSQVILTPATFSEPHFSKLSAANQLTLAQGAPITACLKWFFLPQ